MPICGFCVERELKPLERRRELPHNWGVDRLLGQLYRGEAPREEPALPAPVCWFIQQEQPEQPEAAEEEVSSKRHLPQMECGQVQQARRHLRELQRPGVETHLQLERPQRGELATLRSAAHQERKSLEASTYILHSQLVHIVS